MTKKIFLIVFFSISISNNLLLYVNDSFSSKIHYKLWHVSPPWLFFTKKALEETPSSFTEKCFLQTCDSIIPDIRYKAITFQHNVERFGIRDSYRSFLCPISREQTISYRNINELRAIQCSN